MKKILLVCLLLIAMVVSLAACGGKDNPPSNDGGGETQDHTHSFDDWYVTAKPTCTENGTKVRYCSCGEKQSEIVALIGHTPAEATIEDMVAATYEADGSYNEVVRCSVCYEKLSETQHTIPMLKHTPAEAVTENVIDATCYSEGSYDTVIYCSDCGAELERAKHTVDKIAHTPASAVEENVIDSTCYSVGSKDIVVYCSVDGCHAELERNSVAIGMKAHTPATAVEENRVNPTYEKDGSYQMVVYCSVAACHAELERTTHVLDMLVHHPGGVVIENEVKATCTKNGSYDEAVYCLDADCGHKELSRKTIITDMIAHSGGAAVEENRVNATCYSDGKYDSVVYCAVCSAELSRNTVAIQKIAHTSANAVVENRVEATCTTNGGYDEVVYCSVENCKAEISRSSKIINALGHTEVVDKAVEPTCTATGLTEGKHCSKCNKVIVRQEVVDALSHEWSEWNITVAETCQTVGKEERECLICRNTESRSRDINTNAHTYTVANKNADGHWYSCSQKGCASTTAITDHEWTEWTVTLETTCKSEGSKYRLCCFCEYKATETIPVDPTKHIYEDRICKLCNTEYFSEGITFALNTDGQSYSVTGMGTCKDSKLIIPSTYNGLPVTIISNNAFYRSNITSVIIPDSVTEIMYDAFNRCESLTHVDFGSGLKTIGSWAFVNCHNLKEIILPDGLQSIGESSFGSGYTKTYVIIPNSVTEIGYEAFDVVDTIYCETRSKPSGWASQWYSRYTTSVVWGYYDEYVMIDGLMYGLNGNNAAIVKQPGAISNKNLIIPQTIQYEKRTYTVKWIKDYAFSKKYLSSVVIPDTVVSIGGYAFEYNSFSSITLPKNLVSIDESAFAHNSNLSKIVIPSSVTSIGQWAFADCPYLTIYCKVSSKPSGWNDNWNGWDYPVVWGYRE